jgi:hypothetical protein
MNMRLLPVAGLTGLVSIALASSAVAGGGGWPPPPGNYRQSDVSANASLFGPPTTTILPGKGGGGGGPSEFAYVSVDRGLHTFKPKSGTRLVQQSGTMLSLFAFTAGGGYTSGCWIIADTDFKVASDLSSASLSTTVPAASNCPGAPMNVSPVNGVTGKGGDGGGGGAPTTLSLTWTYKGVVSHAHDNGVLSCGSFQTTAHFDDDHASANAQGAISGASGPMTSDFSSLDKSSFDQVVKGVPADACFS